MLKSRQVNRGGQSFRYTMIFLLFFCNVDVCMAWDFSFKHIKREIKERFHDSPIRHTYVMLRYGEGSKEYKEYEKKYYSYRVDELVETSEKELDGLLEKEKKEDAKLAEYRRELDTFDYKNLNVTRVQELSEKVKKIRNTKQELYPYSAILIREKQWKEEVKINEKIKNFDFINLNVAKGLQLAEMLNHTLGNTTFLQQLHKAEEEGLSNLKEEMRDFDFSKPNMERVVELARYFDSSQIEGASEFMFRLLMGAKDNLAKFAEFNGLDIVKLHLIKDEKLLADIKRFAANRNSLEFSRKLLAAAYLHTSSYEELVKIAEDSLDDPLKIKRRLLATAKDNRSELTEMMNSFDFDNSALIPFGKELADAADDLGLATLLGVERKLLSSEDKLLELAKEFRRKLLSSEDKLLELTKEMNKFDFVDIARGLELADRADELKLNTFEFRQKLLTSVKATKDPSKFMEVMNSSNFNKTLNLNWKVFFGKKLAEEAEKLGLNAASFKNKILPSELELIELTKLIEYFNFSSLDMVKGLTLVEKADKLGLDTSEFRRKLLVAARGNLFQLISFRKFNYSSTNLSGHIEPMYNDFSTKPVFIERRLNLPPKVNKDLRSAKQVDQTLGDPTEFFHQLHKSSLSELKQAMRDFDFNRLNIENGIELARKLDSLLGGDVSVFMYRLLMEAKDNLAKFAEFNGLDFVDLYTVKDKELMENIERLAMNKNSLEFSRKLLAATYLHTISDKELLKIAKDSLDDPIKIKRKLLEATKNKSSKVIEMMGSFDFNNLSLVSFGKELANEADKLGLATLEFRQKLSSSEDKLSELNNAVKHFDLKTLDMVKGLALADEMDELGLSSFNFRYRLLSLAVTAENWPRYMNKYVEMMDASNFDKSLNLNFKVLFGKELAIYVKQPRVDAYDLENKYSPSELVKHPRLNVAGLNAAGFENKFLPSELKLIEFTKLMEYFDFGSLDMVKGLTLADKADKLGLDTLEFRRKLLAAAERGVLKLTSLKEFNYPSTNLSSQIEPMYNNFSTDPVFIERRLNPSKALYSSENKKFKTSNFTEKSLESPAKGKTKEGIDLKVNNFTKLIITKPVFTDYNYLLDLLVSFKRLIQSSSLRVREISFPNRPKDSHEDHELRDVLEAFRKIELGIAKERMRQNKSLVKQAGHIDLLAKEKEGLDEQVIKEKEKDTKLAEYREELDTFDYKNLNGTRVRELLGEVVKIRDTAGEVYPYLAIIMKEEQWKEEAKRDKEKADKLGFFKKENKNADDFPKPLPNLEKEEKGINSRNYRAIRIGGGLRAIMLTNQSLILGRVLDQAFLGNNRLNEIEPGIIKKATDNLSEFMLTKETIDNSLKDSPRFYTKVFGLIKGEIELSNKEKVKNDFYGLVLGADTSVIQFNNGFYLRPGLWGSVFHSKSNLVEDIIIKGDGFQIGAKLDLGKDLFFGSLLGYLGGNWDKLVEQKTADYKSHNMFGGFVLRSGYHLATTNKVSFEPIVTFIYSLNGGQRYSNADGCLVDLAGGSGFSFIPGLRVLFTVSNYQIINMIQVPVSFMSKTTPAFEDQVRAKKVYFDYSLGICTSLSKSLDISFVGGLRMGAQRGAMFNLGFNFKF